MRKWNYFCREHKPNKAELVLASPSRKPKCVICGEKLRHPWRCPTTAVPDGVTGGSVLIEDDVTIEDDDPDNAPCTYCGGDGYGIVGVDWNSDDYINGPYAGEIQQCPNCHGSGLAKDMTFW